MAYHNILSCTFKAAEYKNYTLVVQIDKQNILL